VSRYPDSPAWQAPTVFRNHRPGISGGPAWATQDRNLTRFGLGEVDLLYKYLTNAEIMTLHSFFESVGSAGRFSFADVTVLAWTSLFVVQGDGVDDGPWDLPTFAIAASPAPVVYENGVVKTSEIYTTSTNPTFDYHIKVGAGTDSGDQITPQTATGNGVIVTIDATCRRFFRKAKYANPKNPFSFDVPDIHDQGPVTILEVRR
jgi:hypothetical protein